MPAVATAIRCFALIDLPVELGVKAIGIKGVGGARNTGDDRQGSKHEFARTCAYCGCVYSMTGGRNVVRGYLDNGVLGPGWKPIRA